MRIAVGFENLGPYHVARLVALARTCDTLAIEARARSATYDWAPAVQTPFRRVTLGGSPREARSALERALDVFAPDAVAVPGWSDPLALAMLAWACGSGVPAIVMSASQESDARRRAATEWLKRRLLAHMAGALVGGTPQRRYLERLGMPGEVIRPGYDVVDNAHFQAGSDAARANEARLRAEIGLPPRYFLVSARFVPKKNLLRLLDAHELYRQRAEAQIEPLPLVLLGDGPLRPRIEDAIARRSLDVRLLGFRQHADLPAIYGLAEALILPSLIEQWGLVVNEAMAAGLPVLASRRCGCVPDLLRPGVNGHVFDPEDAAALADLLLSVTRAGPENRARMGAAGRAIIAEWGPDAFAIGLKEVAEMARGRRGRPVGAFDRLLLETLIRRAEPGRAEAA